jgi:ribulose-phosphate 3-epimerase
MQEMDLTLPLIAPSILAADFTKLDEQIQATLKADIQWLHCDVMDGHFVPNISYGSLIVEAAHRSAGDNVFIDTHLMIESPDQYIESFVDAGSDMISVHFEACRNLHRTIQLIRSHGVMAGLAINPHTRVDVIMPILNDLDMVVLMSVNPGFGGQSFIESTFPKLYELIEIRDHHNADFLIEIDGGVTLENAGMIAQAGADVLVAGSSVFKAPDITERTKALTNAAIKGKGYYV